MQHTSSITDLNHWSRYVRQMRRPDFVIGDPENPYMRRWWIIPRNEFSNVYLHEILRSDDDRALHDHPWQSTSIILDGGYIEHTADGVFDRRAGDVIHRDAASAHRLEVIPGITAVTLFMTGPKVREWGFHCPNGWRPWQDFCAPDNSSQVGKGCE